MASEENLESRWIDSRREFYALIGWCVTSYQAVEDYLPNLFESAIGGPKNRADALFVVAKGLEAKLSVLSAAMLGQSQEAQSRWADLAARIKQSADDRNQIAHAYPMLHGGGVVITRTEGETPTVRLQGQSQLKLHKRTKSGGEAQWTVEQMRERTLNNHTLFDDLMGFSLALSDPAGSGETSSE